jgi:hypothetical protein
LYKTKITQWGEIGAPMRSLFERDIEEILKESHFTIILNFPYVEFNLKNLPAP